MDYLTIDSGIKTEKREQDWMPKKKPNQQQQNNLILYKLWQVLLGWVFFIGTERFTCPDMHTRA